MDFTVPVTVKGSPEKPLLIGEYTDNPGAGGYGDCTHLLKAMLSAKLSNAVFFSIADPDAVVVGVE